MPRFNNVRAPNPNPGWFDWLPRKVQCVLVLLFTLPVAVLLFFGGMHCIHTGKPVSFGPGRPVDALEFFAGSAFTLVVSGSIFAVLMGWAKPLTAHVSETHMPRAKK